MVEGARLSENPPADAQAKAKAEPKSRGRRTRAGQKVGALDGVTAGPLELSAEVPSPSHPPGKEGEFICPPDFRQADGSPLFGEGKVATRRPLSTPTYPASRYSEAQRR